MSSTEYVFISANIRAMFREKYQCEKTLKELKARKKELPENYQAEYEKGRGCGIVTERVIDRIGDIKFNTCLCKFVFPALNQLLIVTSNYERGILPFDGALMRQPARVIELIELCRCAKIEEENERAKEQEKRARAKAATRK